MCASLLLTHKRWEVSSSDAGGDDGDGIQQKGPSLYSSRTYAQVVGGKKGNVVSRSELLFSARPGSSGRDQEGQVWLSTGFINQSTHQVTNPYQEERFTVQVRRTSVTRNAAAKIKSTRKTSKLSLNKLLPLTIQPPVSSSPMSTLPTTTPPPSTAANTPATEILEVSVLPPPSSRFILPPPRSDLLDRLQAFLPQIKSANEQLVDRIPIDGETEGEEEEEGVVLQFVDSSDESSSSSSDEDSEEEDDASSGEEADGIQGEAEGETGEEDRMKKLLEIDSIGRRPKVSPKEFGGNSDALGAGKKAGIVEME